MKNQYFLFLLIFIGCIQKNSRVTKVKFNETYANFGSIDNKDTLRYNFLVKNIGENSLRIDTVTASCGCISYNWMKAPILKGCYGYVSVVFKPNAGETGKQMKTIMVSSNTPEIFTALRVFYKVEEN